MDLGVAFATFISVGRVGASVVDVARKVNKVCTQPGKQEELSLCLYQALHSVQQPLTICAEYAKRFTTHDAVHPAVVLARRVARQCEEFTERWGLEEGDPTATPPSSQVSGYVPAVTAELESLVGRLSLAMNALTLALATLTAVGPLPSPWVWEFLPAAREAAVDKLRALRLGRIPSCCLAQGELYILTRTSSIKKTSSTTPSSNQVPEALFSTGCRIILYIEKETNQFELHVTPREVENQAPALQSEGGLAHSTRGNTSQHLGERSGSEEMSVSRRSSDGGMRDEDPNHRASGSRGFDLELTRRFQRFQRTSWDQLQWPHWDRDDTDMKGQLMYEWTATIAGESGEHQYALLFEPGVQQGEAKGTCAEVFEIMLVFANQMNLNACRGDLSEAQARSALSRLRYDHPVDSTAPNSTPQSAPQSTPQSAPRPIPQSTPLQSAPLHSTSPYRSLSGSLPLNSPQEQQSTAITTAALPHTSVHGFSNTRVSSGHLSESSVETEEQPSVTDVTGSLSKCEL